MRLLERNSNGKISLRDFPDKVPRYAILSHTWGADEVVFKDLSDGTEENRLGYKKIAFCGDQASRDGLQYFWVDTCCIDKSGSAELQEAINCMFRWYRDAAKCYVYLADVSTSASGANDQSSQPTWELAFRKSRWFTRGWTLQELIAPVSVEFFSKEGEHLGNKRSLEQHIRDITRVPATALRGNPLSEFSVAERMAWMETRETIREEDKAYSLFGIFDIQMPLIYGEGREKAFKRLREEINKSLKGVHYDDFSVAFGLSDTAEIEHFVAREEELKEIQKSLGSDGSRRIVVIHGLGGIGKTQLAVAYAKRYRDKYSAVFWLNIKDEDSLKQSFASIAKRILREHPSASRLNTVDFKGDLEDVVDAVKAWLSLPNNTRWLMIYDNYDNPKLPGNTDAAALDICKSLPESYQGSVIITTRCSQVRVGHRIGIGKLAKLRDSLEILSNMSRRQGLIDDPDAVRLATELDGFPLALATAGAYLDQVAISFGDYLRLYQESWAKLQKTSPQLSSYEDRTLYSTWQLSYDHIKQQNKLSAQLLCLWAYFDNQDIWLELLQHDEPENPSWIRELTADEINFNSAIRVLSDHGLVEVDLALQEQIESTGYSMHACVHAWTIHVLNQEWDHDLARLAVTFVASHIPANDTAKWWLTQRRLIRHAARCLSIMANDTAVDNGIEWVSFNLGFLYRGQGKLDEAEQMYQRALQGKEKALGPDHTSTLHTVNNLGILYKDQGKLDEAEQMYRRALQGYEKALGPNHTSTLDTVNNLGLLYKDQGKLDEAEQMYQRALQGSEKALGPDHTSTLHTVNNLGILYKDQGKLDEAEQMYRRALQGYEKALSPDHTSTLHTVNNLGLLYMDQGKLDEAEQMYRRALQGYEKALSPDHTSTLDTVNNLGLLYSNQGKLDVAEQMYRRALQGYEKALGLKAVSRYRPALNTTWNLGDLFATQGKPSEARVMYLRASSGFEGLLGPSSYEYQRLKESIASLDSTNAVADNQPSRDIRERKKFRSTIGKYIRRLLP